jgi:hypothetical protein
MASGEGRSIRGGERNPSSNKSAALTRKNGAASVTKLGAGDYEVVFGASVASCAYNATLGTADTADPPAGEVGVSQRAGNANAVRVVTRESAGTAADRPFHLTVVC